MLTHDRSDCRPGRETMTRDQMEAHLALRGWEQGYFPTIHRQRGLAGMRHAGSNMAVYVGALGPQMAIGGDYPITPWTLPDEDFWKLALRVVQLAQP